MKKIILVFLILGVVAVLLSAIYFWFNSTGYEELGALLTIAGAIFGFLIALGANIRGWLDLLTKKETGDSGYLQGINHKLQDYLILQYPKPLSIHQLPSSPSDFFGRLSVKRKLIQAANKTNVLGLFGMGGIGKTSLGLTVAEKLSAKYTEAQLFLDLHSYDFDGKLALSAANVMEYVIRSLSPNHPVFFADAGNTKRKSNPFSRLKMAIERFVGIENFIDEPRKIDDLFASGELTAIYRSLLSEKRVLVFLDNVLSSDQIISVIPPKESLLIITSRHQIVVPGLAGVNLDTLSSDESVSLINSICKMTKRQAKALAEQCGYLPLAMRVTAGILLTRTDWSPENLVAKLQNETINLDQVDRSIKLSYDLLTDKLKYRFLALSDLSTFDASDAEKQWRWGELPSFLAQLVRLSKSTRYESAIALVYFYALFNLYIYSLFQFPNWIYYCVQLTPLLFIYAISRWLREYEPPSLSLEEVDESLGAFLNANIIIFDKLNRNYKMHDLIRSFAKKCL